MSLNDVDWMVVALRGGGTVALWLAIGLLRRYLLRWLKSAEGFISSMNLGVKEIRALQWAVDIILMVIGLGFTLFILDLMSIFWVSRIGPQIIALVLIWTAVWVLVRYLSHWIEALDERIEEIEIDPRDLKTIDRLLDLIIIIIGITASLAVLELTPLLYSALTAAGIISVMIGFAVQDVAANFISGIFLLIDRPFVVGDTISIKDYSGTVNKISLRSTEIITFDGPIVTIPNSTLAVEPTTNYTLSEDRRVRFTVSVLNTADLNLVINTIQEVLRVEERLLPEKSPSILLNQLRDYAVDFQITAYTRSGEVFDTQSDLQREVVTAFGKKGIELAVPLRKNLNPFIQTGNSYHERHSPRTRKAPLQLPPHTGGESNLPPVHGGD